jgi:hypothetical protein
MNTFFFIHVKITGTGSVIRFGPYATIGAAAEIMVDCLPMLLAAELSTTPLPSYEASISEWMINDDAWEMLTIKITENRKG